MRMLRHDSAYSPSISSADELVSVDRVPKSRYAASDLQILWKFFAVFSVRVIGLHIIVLKRPSPMDCPDCGHPFCPHGVLFSLICRLCLSDEYTISHF